MALGCYPHANKTDHVKLLKPLPKPIWKNREIQPLRGVPRPDFDYPKLSITNHLNKEIKK
jgi:hypothetical protein